MSLQKETYETDNFTQKVEVYFTEYGYIETIVVTSYGRVFDFHVGQFEALRDLMQEVKLGNPRRKYMQQLKDYEL